MKKEKIKLSDLQLFTAMYTNYNLYTSSMNDNERIEFAGICKHYDCEIERRKLKKKYQAFKILIEEMGING